MGTGMAIGGAGYDPYFMQAYMYNNPYYMAQLQAMMTQQAGQGTTSAPQNTATNTPAKKDHSTAGMILGAVALIGASALCHKAYKAGNGTKFFSKMGDGFKSLWNSSKNKIAKFTNPEKFTVLANGEKTVCTIPGEINKISGKNVVAEAEKLGISSEVSLLRKLDDGKSVLGEGISIDDFIIDHKKYGVINIKNGKIAEWTTKKGNTTTHSKNADDRSEVVKLIEKIRKGETFDDVSDIVFKHTAADGTVRTFTAAASDATPTLTEVATKYHSLESDAVAALRLNNESLDKAINAFTLGQESGLKATKFKITDNSAGTFIRENDKIAQIITPEGKTLNAGTKEFDAWHYNHKDAYETALKKKAEECTAIAWQI